MGWQWGVQVWGSRLHGTVKMPLPPCSPPSQAGLRPPSAVFLTPSHGPLSVRALSQATVDAAQMTHSHPGTETSDGWQLTAGPFPGRSQVMLALRYGLMPRVQRPRHLARLGTSLKRHPFPEFPLGLPRLHHYSTPPISLLPHRCHSRECPPPHNISPSQGLLPREPRQHISPP